VNQNHSQNLQTANAAVINGTRTDAKEIQIRRRGVSSRNHQTIARKKNHLKSPAVRIVFTICLTFPNGEESSAKNAEIDHNSLLTYFILIVYLL